MQNPFVIFHLLLIPDILCVLTFLTTIIFFIAFERINITKGAKKDFKDCLKWQDNKKYILEEKIRTRKMIKRFRIFITIICLIFLSFIIFFCISNSEKNYNTYQKITNGQYREIQKSEDLTSFAGKNYILKEKEKE